MISLQETHWPFSNEWVTDRYYVIHSGETRQGGLLCLISKQFCTQHDISWTEYIPGRLLHIRIHGSSKHLDFVAVYQHVHAPHRLEQRLDLWTQMNTLLTRLGRKHTLVMVGDFNTSLQRVTSAVGLATYQHHRLRGKGPQHSDSHYLMNLLTTFELMTMNTWDPQLGPTYTFGEQHSRIDYLICRQAHRDQHTTQIQYLEDFPLLPVTGAKHVPMLCSVLKVWHSTSPSQTTGWTRAQRLDLCQHWLQPTERIAAMQSQVQQSMNDLSPEGDRLTKVHNALGAFQPDTSKQTSTPLYRFDLTPFRRFQAHSQALRHLRARNLQGLFKAWFHAHHKQCARQQMKINSSTARKRKIQHIYEVAHQASRAKDHFRLYQAVRELAPRQIYKRVILRAEDGKLLTPQEEADWLMQWFMDLYKDDSCQLHCHPFLWPFSAEEMTVSFSTLPLRKALAPGYAPAPFWRLTAQPASDFLFPYFQQCSFDGHLPLCWSLGSLHFIPKGPKRCQTPKDLRPIALLEPCGKAVLGAFAVRLLNEIGTELKRWPQFAYLDQRGTDDALQRLAAHCTEVRDIVDTFKFQVHQTAQGNLPGVLGGGATLSLDLSKAFDMVDREQLVQSLVSLGVSSDLIHLIQCVYSQTSFEFQHKGETRDFGTHRGIRQGCRAAPSLWTVFSVSVLAAIANNTTPEWVRRCVSMFADDACLHQAIRSDADLHCAMKFFGLVLDALEAANMRINLEKTIAIWRLTGPHAKKLQHQSIREKDDHWHFPCHSQIIWQSHVHPFGQAFSVFGDHTQLLCI